MRFWGYCGRLVCIGDSINKITFIRELGPDAATQDVVVLVNELHLIVQKAPNPSTGVLEKEFLNYDGARLENPRTIGSKLVRAVLGTFVSYRFLINMSSRCSGKSYCQNGPDVQCFITMSFLISCTSRKRYLNFGFVRQRAPQ
jgi:hypothetical protein